MTCRDVSSLNRQPRIPILILIVIVIAPKTERNAITIKIKINKITIKIPGFPELDLHPD